MSVKLFVCNNCNGLVMVHLLFLLSLDAFNLAFVVKSLRQSCWNFGVRFNTFRSYNLLILYYTKRFTMII